MWWHMWSAKQISQTFHWWENANLRRPTLCSFCIVMMLLRESFLESVVFVPDTDVFLLLIHDFPELTPCTLFRTVEEINCVISLAANAAKLLGRYKRQHCLVSALWLDVTWQYGLIERPNRFGWSNFIVQEKML